MSKRKLPKPREVDSSTSEPGTDLKALVEADKRDREAEGKAVLDELAQRLRLAFLPVMILSVNGIEPRLEIRALD